MKKQIGRMGPLGHIGQTRQNTRQGFTIVELLIYLALVTILITLMTSIFLTALETQIAAQTSSSSQIAGRFIFTRLEYDIHRASSVTTPAALGASSPQLVLSIGGETYTYAQTGTNLTLTVGANTNVVNDEGTEVSGLNFTLIGNTGGKPTVVINMTITGTGSQPPEIRTYETTIGTR